MLKAKTIYLMKMVISIYVTCSFQQRHSFNSPCPDVFQYDSSGDNSPDRWFGIITIRNSFELNGVWLRIILDKPAIQLGNWFGEVKAKDNVEFIIRDKNRKLAPNEELRVRFFIRHDSVDSNNDTTVPKLVAIQLNARTICPDLSPDPYSKASTVAGSTHLNGLHTSATVSSLDDTFDRGTTKSVTVSSYSVRPTMQTVQVPVQGRQLVTSVLAHTGSDEDVYTADFRPGRKPIFLEILKIESDKMQCGVTVMKPRPLITNGQKTSEKMWPWHVALYHSKGIDLKYICGASLISRTFVITVAHCVAKNSRTEPIDADSLILYFGKYHLRSWLASSGVQDRQAERIFIHPNYNASNFRHDIALVKLKSAVDYTDYVRPVCLWHIANDSLNSILNKDGLVVGWGYDEKGKITLELTMTHMPVVSQQICIWSHPDFFSRFTSSYTFCAGFRNGTSVCNGDSGGGLVFPLSGNVWYLRGLVSISVALQDSFVCDPNHYVIFTDIAKYLTWINETMHS